MSKEEKKEESYCSQNTQNNRVILDQIPICLSHWIKPDFCIQNWYYSWTVMYLNVKRKAPVLKPFKNLIHGNWNRHFSLSTLDQIPDDHMV